ncbi:hypothetical protein [Luteolibacter soli]|uniref:Uncharacterized protein n=1 Tax=Luteolibacter soli TaxID=3135280 RepID=A0ABU9AVT3_9BACT
MPNRPDLKQTENDSAEVLSLARRRWFAIALCVLSMTVGALTFSLSFPQTGPTQSAHVLTHIFMGPFCHASYFPWFRPVPRVVIPWAAVLLLLSHPLFPRPLTVITTLIGGGLWWLMGWYCIAVVT